MIEHPNDDTLRGFATGGLSSTDLLGVDDHLSVCDACRSRIARLARAGEELEHLAEHLHDPLAHLTEEDVQSFVQGTCPESQKFEIARHLADCDVCRRQVDELSAWTRASSALRRRLIPAAAAAAVLIVGAWTARTWYSQRSSHEAAAPSGILQSLSSDARAQVNDALRDGVASLPPFMADLVPPRETLMGRADTHAGFEIEGPAGTAVVEDRPVFVWQPLPGDGGYVVTVSDESGAIVLRSPPLTATRWTAAGPLTRSRTYTWQVSAERNGRTRTAPAPPEPPARFRVIDAAAAADLQHLAQQSPPPHAILGILYMENGIRQSAIAELAQVPPGDPYSEIARRSLARLEASIPRRSQ